MPYHRVYDFPRQDIVKKCRSQRNDELAATHVQISRQIVAVRLFNSRGILAARTPE